MMKTLSNTPNIRVMLGDRPLPLSPDENVIPVLDYLSGALRHQEEELEIADEPIYKGTKKRNRKRGIRK